MHHDSPDPWADYSADHATRIAYYPVPAWPTCFVDGTIDAWPYSTLPTHFDTRFAIESPIMLNMTANLLGNQVEVDVSVTTADEAVTGNHKIRICLIDIDMPDFWTASNGQDDYHYDVLQYAPDAEGLVCEVAANSTEDFNVSFPWPININGVDIADDNFRAVAFVQNDDTKEVLNAEWVLPLACNIVMNPLFETKLIEAGDELNIPTTIANVAPFEDVFTITVDSDIPEGWTFEYTTPDGPQTGNSTVNMAANSDFMCDVAFFSDETHGDDASVTLTISSQELPDQTKSVTYYVLAGGDVLFVNDANGLYSDFYTTSLENIDLTDEFTMATWDQSLYDFNTMDLEEVAPGIIIWFSGGEGNVSIDDFAGLQSYLNGGGKLWMTGSNLPFNLADSDLIEMMGASYQARFAADLVFGDDEDPYFGDIEVSLGGGDGSDDLGDPCSLSEDGGSSCLRYNMVRRAGICNETDIFSTLIMGFPFEAVATAEERDALMLASINFLLGNDTPEDGSELLKPAEFALEQNYPNPFNPSTKIAFTLAEAGIVKLAVYDIQGREVATLVNESLQHGEHELTFNAEDLPSGVYFARLIQDSQVQTRKMLLVK